MVISICIVWIFFLMRMSLYITLIIKIRKRGSRQWELLFQEVWWLERRGRQLKYAVLFCFIFQVEEDGTFGGGGGGGAGAERLESVLESGCLLQSDVALRPDNDWTRADVVEGAGELWGFPTLFQGQTVFKVMLRYYLPFYFRSLKSVQWNFSRLRDCMTVAVIPECLQEQVRSIT